MAADRNEGALSLDVARFADERADDLARLDAMLLPLISPDDASATVQPPARQRARHERRRGASHMPWKSHWASVPAARRRRDLRRVRLLQIRAKNRANGRLETEAWHVKRFKMVLIGGIRLPLRARNRGVRAAVRTATHGCVVHDASYWRCLRLSGREAAVIALLERATGMAKDVLTRMAGGGREAPTSLQHQQIPVRLLACVPNHNGAAADDAMGSSIWWVFVHDASVAAARAALIEAASEAATAAPAAADAAVDVRSGPALVRFQLRGPTSHATLARSLQLLEAEEEEGGGGVESAAAAWRALMSLKSPAVLPPRAILGVRVRHPSHATTSTRARMRTPAQTKGHAAGDPSSMCRQLRSLVCAWPAALAASPLYRGEAASSLAGASSSSSAAAVEMLLIQQPACAPERAKAGRERRSGATPPGDRAAFGCGWDVLLPAGTSSAARAVWLALILGGAHAIGLAELRGIFLHAAQGKGARTH